MEMTYPHGCLRLAGVKNSHTAFISRAASKPNVKPTLLAVAGHAVKANRRSLWPCAERKGNHNMVVGEPGQGKQGLQVRSGGCWECEWDVLV